MRVAVTTIMKDEPTEFIERWKRANGDADELVLTDTGSSNEAVECAKDLGITVHQILVRPWRFDVARNTGLSLLGEDFDTVITVDVDEVLTPGWRDALEDAGPAARHAYNYVWSWTEDGNPDVQFTGNRAHSRFGWVWRHPVHESLYWAGEGPEPETRPTTLEIHHHADPNKPRAQYLPLLAQAVSEAPTDDRMAHYYARELFFRNDWVAARREFVRHLALPTATWAPERAQSYRYLAKMDDFPERWILRALAEDPNRREAWVDLVDLWLRWGRPDVASGIATRALTIEARPGDYMSEAHAWDNEWLSSVAG